MDGVSIATFEFGVYALAAGRAHAVKRQAAMEAINATLIKTLDTTLFVVAFIIPTLFVCKLQRIGFECSTASLTYPIKFQSIDHCIN
jgi:hypothetical protein